MKTISDYKKEFEDKWIRDGFNMDDEDYENCIDDEKVWEFFETMCKEMIQDYIAFVRSQSPIPTMIADNPEVAMSLMQIDRHNGESYLRFKEIVLGTGKRMKQEPTYKKPKDTFTGWVDISKGDD